MASMENQTIGDREINMHEEMRRAFALLSGKWKLEIMWLLNQRTYRFGELRTRRRRGGGSGAADRPGEAAGGERELFDADDARRLGAGAERHVLPVGRHRRGHDDLRPRRDDADLRLEERNAAPVEEVVVLGVSVGGAKVVKTDIAASNGVIHVIDTVLMP